MTRIEKGILGTIAALLFVMAILVTYTINAIDEAGGMKAVIVEAGKEIKDIGEQIAED